MNAFTWYTTEQILEIDPVLKEETLSAMPPNRWWFADVHGDIHGPYNYKDHDELERIRYNCVGDDW